MADWKNSDETPSIFLQGWALLAVTNPGVKDTYHAETQAGWIVLGVYHTEDDVYSEYVKGGSEDDGKWRDFLQKELIRLAEKKGLGAEATLFVTEEIMCLEGIKNYA